MVALPDLAHAEDLRLADAALTPDARDVLAQWLADDAVPALDGPGRLGFPRSPIGSRARELALRVAAYRHAHPDRPNAVAAALRVRLRDVAEATATRRPEEMLDPRAMRLAALNFPPLYRGATLRGFAVRDPDPAVAEKLAAVREWGAWLVRRWRDRDDLGNDYPVLAALIGPSGTGKTHIGYALANALAGEYGATPVVTTAAELVTEIRDGWSRERGAAGVAARAARYRDADFLVLDDCSRHAIGGDVAGILLDVLDARERWRRPTVLTSNDALAGFEALVGPAVFSRLLRYRAVHDLAGVPDFRERIATGGRGAVLP